MQDKRLKSLTLVTGGTGLAFNIMPKRSVTVLDNRKNDTTQDLDARRKTTIKII
jgi:hypothetical protein